MLLPTLLFSLLPILIFADPDCHDPTAQILPRVRDCAEVVNRFYASIAPHDPVTITVSGFRQPRMGLRTPFLYRNPVNPRSTCAIYINTRMPTDEDTFLTRLLADGGLHIIDECFPSRTGTVWIPPRRVVSVALVNPRHRGFENVTNMLPNGLAWAKGNGTGSALLDSDILAGVGTDGE